MINQDQFSRDVCARMFDYFNVRVGWYRKSWDLGLPLGLRELGEAVSAHDQGYLSSQSVSWLAGSLKRPAGWDPGVGSSEMRRTLQQCLNSSMIDGSADHGLLLELAARVNDGYLDNWSSALAEPVQYGPEKVARALAEHLLDHGFDAQLLHRWLSFHVNHNPEILSLSDLALKAAALRREPPPVFEVIAGVSPLPGSRKPEGWMKMRFLRKWLEDEGYSLRNLRIGGGIRFLETAVDKWSAVANVLQRLDQYEARVKLGTRERRLRIEAIWVAGTDGEKFDHKPSRNVDVLSLARQDRLFYPAGDNPVDAALQLAAPVDDGPLTTAVAGGWAAIETALTAPGDKNNVVAADRLAEIVACSYPRAELTKLSAAYEQQMDDDLAAAISKSSNHRERCRVMLQAIAEPGINLTFKQEGHMAGVARMKRMVDNPRRELTEVRDRATRSFRWLYRHRNLLLHGGLRDAAGVGRSLDAVAPILGAGLDRLAHAWIAGQTQPLSLATRAKIEIELLGGKDGSPLMDLLEFQGGQFEGDLGFTEDQARPASSASASIR